MSRKHRKIYKQGKQEGYLEGYAQGLHDGNPFVMFAESFAKVTDNLVNCLNNMSLEERQALMNSCNSEVGEADDD